MNKIIKICKKHGELTRDQTYEVKRIYIPVNPEKYNPLQYYCKECRNQKARNYYKKHAQKIIQSQKKYSDLHKEKIKLYKKNRRLDNPNLEKNTKLKRSYGINLNTFDNMKKQQENKCLICKKISKLHVDHCHKTKKVRGLLCTKCNMAIGLFKDCINNLENAILYLKSTLY